MYKLIAIDLDETLLTTEKTVSQRNKEVLQQADAMGVRIVIATGRGIAEVQDTLEAIGFEDKENEYVISFNGGAITENKGTKYLYREGISFEFASELYKRGLTYDVSVQVYTLDDIFVYNYTDAERAHLEPEIQVTEIFDENIDFLKDTQIMKVIYMNEDREYLEQIEEDFNDITMNSDVSYSSNRYIEFNHKGVNKGSSLKRLADLLGISMSETMVIGDNFNDWSMFKVAGFSVGVANLVEPLRDEVDYISEKTHEEDGVAAIIEKFIFNAKDVD